MFLLTCEKLAESQFSRTRTVYSSLHITHALTIKEDNEKTKTKTLSGIRTTESRLKSNGQERILWWEGGNWEVHSEPSGCSTTNLL